MVELVTSEQPEEYRGLSSVSHLCSKGYAMCLLTDSSRLLAAWHPVVFEIHSRSKFRDKSESTVHCDSGRLYAYAASAIRSAAHGPLLKCRCLLRRDETAKCVGFLQPLSRLNPRQSTVTVANSPHGRTSTCLPELLSSPALLNNNSQSYSASIENVNSLFH